MKTNYNNLTFFEVCAVFMAVVGLVLIGIQIFITLPKTQQVQVSSAFTLLDMHDQAEQALEVPQFALASMQNFYDQFDVAFNQLFSFPDAVGAPVIKFASALDDYSSNVAMSYTKNNVGDSPNLGEVLGAMIINEQTRTVSAPVANYQKQENVSKQYYYHAPGVVQKLIK